MSKEGPSATVGLGHVFLGLMAYVVFVWFLAMMAAGVGGIRQELCDTRLATLTTAADSTAAIEDANKDLKWYYPHEWHCRVKAP